MSANAMGGNPFDERAATWDEDPAKRERARVVASAIRAVLPLDRGMRMLEYGAGTGLVSQRLQEAVGAVTLADSSAGMLEVLHGKVERGLLPGARVWDLDVTRDRVPDERFGLLVTVMTLHHIPDVEKALGALASLTETDGHLCVVDLEAEDGSFHDADFEGHEGFVREDLRVLLERSGFVDVRFDPCGRVAKHGRDYPLFLATSRRAGPKD